MTTQIERIKVWDPVVRIGHWTLVSSFFIAYFTEDDLLQVHVWAGYVLGGVVTLRILWGFIGSKYARFSSFLYSPATTLAYLKSLSKKSAKRYIGHNPAGSAMIFALLLGLMSTVYSGLMLYALEENAGPFSGWVENTSTQPSLGLFSRMALADDRKEHHEDDEDDESEEFWEEFHEVSANLTLVLILFHVTGVIVSGLMHRENLVKAMITGYKESKLE